VLFRSQNSLQLEVTNDELVQLSLFSTDGKQIMSLKDMNHGTHSIRMNHESGMYILLGQTKEGFVQTQKIWVE